MNPVGSATESGHVVQPQPPQSWEYKHYLCLVLFHSSFRGTFSHIQKDLVDPFKAHMGYDCRAVQLTYGALKLSQAQNGISRGTIKVCSLSWVRGGCEHM